MGNKKTKKLILITLSIFLITVSKGQQITTAQQITTGIDGYLNTINNRLLVVESIKGYKLDGFFIFKNDSALLNIDSIVKVSSKSSVMNKATLDSANKYASVLSKSSLDSNTKYTNAAILKLNTDMLLAIKNANDLIILLKADLEATKLKLASLKAVSTTNTIIH
jgi:hypothetical protein